jgi:lipoprotein-anchoring transpeptidase ErfK/SrfK
MHDDFRPADDRRALVSRRFLLAALPLTLAGCVGGAMPVRITDARRDPNYLAMYGPIGGEEHPVPAIDLRQVQPAFYRREVPYTGPEAPGTIVVDAGEKYLYLVRGDGSAMRYGIGVGREGFGWSGRATIQRKARWPSWHPPVEMQARDEKARKWADGMPGGIQNPLGARALYLYQGGKDTLYRIHGTNEPWTIGSNVSSGCIRMMNQDAIDLYERVPTGTEVVVLPAAAEGGPLSVIGGFV